MANQEKALVFITGATGFIGSQVTLATLKADCRVRLSVRKAEDVQKLRETFAAYSKQLDFVIVPDITREDAFEHVLGGVDYIFHLASPMPGKGSDVRVDYVDPAIQGTNSILRAAKITPSVKRVVVTSSILALIPIGSMHSTDLYVQEASNHDTRVDLDKPFPEGFDGVGMKYQASKILAHQFSLEWVTKHKPHFSLITLHPTFVLGRSLVQRSAKEIDGINAFLWQSLQSEKPNFPPVFIDVRDVADAHIKAMDVAVKDEVTEFLLSGNPSTWEDAAAFVRAKYPSIQVKLQPPFKTGFRVDTSKSEKVLGLRWRTMEEIFSSVLDQQMEFRA